MILGPIVVVEPFDSSWIKSQNRIEAPPFSGNLQMCTNSFDVEAVKGLKLKYYWALGLTTTLRFVYGMFPLMFFGRLVLF